MKKGIIAGFALLAGALCVPAGAEGFKLSTGATLGVTDVLGTDHADQDFNPVMMPSAEGFANLTWTAKPVPDGVMTLGLNACDNFLFLSAKKNGKTVLAEAGTASTWTNFASTGLDGEWAESVKIMPMASWTQGPLALTLQMPLFVNLASTGVSSDAVQAMNGGKGFKYLAAWMASAKNNATAANTAIPYDDENSILWGTMVRGEWKFRMDKDFSVSTRLEAEVALVPLWFTDAAAGVAVQTGPVTTDIKGTFYMTPNDPLDLDNVASGAMIYPWLDPKVTLDCASLGVKGLKFSLAGSLPLVYGTNAAGDATAASGVSVTPGFTWKIDNLTLDFTSAFMNVDQGITASPSSTPAFTGQLEWSPKLKIAYDFAF